MLKQVIKIGARSLLMVGGLLAASMGSQVASAIIPPYMQEALEKARAKDASEQAAAQTNVDTAALTKLVGLITGLQEQADELQTACAEVMARAQQNPEQPNIKLSILNAALSDFDHLKQEVSTLANLDQQATPAAEINRRIYEARGKGNMQVSSLLRARRLCF